MSTITVYITKGRNKPVLKDSLTGFFTNTMQSYPETV